MSALIVIPARLASARFPGKPLARLGDRPLVQHVYENSIGSALADSAVVATDSEEIFRVVEAFGGRSLMTSPDCASGTDRAAEAAANPDYAGYDIIVNVQGDEPLIRPEMIDAVIGLLAGDERASIGTLARAAEDPEDIENPNVVKVVLDREGFALYFSRSPIPYRKQGSEATVLQHVGIYGYRKDALLRLASTEPSALERAEGLEQLRALEHGMRIKVGLTQYRTIGVDTPEDLERVGKWLNSYS